MSGFGRKGLGLPATTPTPASRFGRAVPAAPAAIARPASSLADEMAAKRQAFIESERLRNAPGAGPGGYEGDHQGTGNARPQRSLAMAYVLWFVLGQVSAHRFYLGRMQSAMCQVGLFIISLIAVLTDAPWIGAIGIAVWSLWILGDVFVIRKIHKQDWQRQPAFAGVFN